MTTNLFITESLLIAAQQHLREQGFTGRFCKGEQDYYDLFDVLYDWVLSDHEQARIDLLIEDAVSGGHLYEDVAEGLTALIV